MSVAREFQTVGAAQRKARSAKWSNTVHIKKTKKEDTEGQIEAHKNKLDRG